VGCSTVVANLAAALQALGHQTAAVDLHSGGDLGLHYGLDQHNDSGWASALVRGESSLGVLFESADGRRVTPFGQLPKDQFDKFQGLLPSSEQAVASFFAPLEQAGAEWLLLDAPALRDQAMQSPAVRQFFSALATSADYVLHVACPDASAYLKLKLRDWELGEKPGRNFILVNNTDVRASVARDLEWLILHEFEECAIPLGVHQDKAIPEAVAQMNCVNRLSPTSQASADFHALALWCLGRAGKDFANE
jgi:cellulose synthase operon protein YhjQ